MQSVNVTQKKEGGPILLYEGDEFTAAAFCYGECEATMTCCHRVHPLTPEPAVFLPGQLAIGCLDKSHGLVGPARAVKHPTTMQFYKTRRGPKPPYT